LAEFSDHSFHGVEDAKKFLGLPVLGAIAKIANKEEVARQKAREKRTTIIIIGLFLLLIITAIVGSFIQEIKITQEIIETEISEETAM
jgi:capsular polysaccharide biosynthesis protein